MEETKEFQLSAHELEYLKQTTMIDESMGGWLRFSEGATGHRATVRLSRYNAERLRAVLTTQLAKLGFDSDYSPNEQGRMLEELIDRFYIP